MKVKPNPENPEINNYRDLTPGKLYRVIGIEADDFRIMSDEGRPYLYPHELFSIEDPEEPDDWETKFGEDGERYSYPKELNRVGFFEDYFDDDPVAVTTLHQYLARFTQE